jgi:hypothetical protein
MLGQKQARLSRMAATLLLMFIIAPSPVWAVQSSDAFTDVPRDHWAWKNGTLPWAAESGILGQTQGNPLKPGEIITEEEFITLMMRLFANTRDELGSGTTDEVYALAQKYNLPAVGITDPAKRKTELTRIQVARLLAAANGRNYNNEGAIAYMYEHGITKGTDGESTIAGYGNDKKVSRVEAIQFLKMAHDKGIASTMQVMPKDPMSNPNTSQFISSSQETVYANLQKAQTPLYGRTEDAGERNYWVKQLYEIAKKMGTSHDGKLRVYVPAITENKTIIYHVATDQWHSGQITKKGNESPPAYLEFPGSENWSVMLIVKEGDAVISDMYYDTASQTIEINNVVIQKHVKK